MASTIQQHKIQLETLILDYGFEETMSAYKNSKKYFGRQARFYNYDIAVGEYGSFDDLVLASLMYSIERTGGLDRFSETVKQFVNRLEKETRTLGDNVRLNSFSEVQREYIYPPVSSAEEQYLYLISPPIPPSKGVYIPIGQGVSLVSLTKKQKDAVITFAATRSRKITGEFMGISATAVKQLLQRARKALQ